MTILGFEILSLAAKGLHGAAMRFAEPLQAASSDDTILLLMAFLYEILPPAGTH